MLNTVNCVNLSRTDIICIQPFVNTTLAGKGGFFVVKKQTNKTLIASLCVIVIYYNSSVFLYWSFFLSFCDKKQHLTHVSCFLVCFQSSAVCEWMHYLNVQVRLSLTLDHIVSHLLTTSLNHAFCCKIFRRRELSWNGSVCWKGVWHHSWSWCWLSVCGLQSNLPANCFCHPHGTYTYLQMALC